jgi:hypothetical protein
MKSKEFIKKELENLVKQFSQIRVRYEFRKRSDVHYIEVIPNKIYSLNDDYIKWESDMWDRFVEQFPYEGICFISDDSLISIKNAELTLFGADYTPITIKEEISLDIVSIFVRQAELKIIDIFNESIKHNKTMQTGTLYKYNYLINNAA